MDRLIDILGSSGGAVMSGRRIVLNLVLSFLMGLGIAAIYRHTHRSLSFSRSFSVSLVLLNVIVCAAMMAIGNNLARAFGMVGALSLVRFRTVLKDTKDITFVFLSLVIGMACGTTNYKLALISSALTGVFVLLLDKMRFGAVPRDEYLLKIQMSGSDGQSQAVQRLFGKFLSDSVFLGLHVMAGGEGTEVSYSVRLKGKKDMQAFVEQLRAIEGVERVGVISAAQEVEP